MTAHTFSVVTVTMESRPDAGLRVYSDDLPGLVLSGKDRGTVAEAIAPAIRALFEHRGIRNIAVHPALPLSDVLNNGHADAPDQSRAQFVVELLPA